jgi:hypothetical protein
MVADLLHVCASDNTTHIVFAFRRIAKLRVIVGALSSWLHVAWLISRGWLLICCRVARQSANKPILSFEPSENVSSRQHAARQRTVWRISLAAGRQTRCLALCRVVASDNATR